MFKFIKNYRERRLRKYYFLKTGDSFKANEMYNYIQAGKIEYPLGNEHYINGENVLHDKPFKPVCLA